MTREGKILELINNYLIYDKLDIEYDNFNMSLSSKLYKMLDFYTIFWDMRTKGNRDYKSSIEFLKVVEITLNKVMDKYAPKVTPEQAKEKEIMEV